MARYAQHLEFAPANVDDVAVVNRRTDREGLYLMVLLRDALWSRLAQGLRRDLGRNLLVLGTLRFADGKRRPNREDRVELDPGVTVSWLSLGGQEMVIDGTTESEIDYSDAPAAALGSACTDEPCWPGWELANIQVTARTEFLEQHPDAAELFRQVELTVEDVARQNQRYSSGENTEADVERHAQEWIAENRPTVDGWLAAARAAG